MADHAIRSTDHPITRSRDVLALLLVAALALVLRLVFPWSTVFDGGGVDFLEADAWYHARVVEHQVRNFPHRLTVDPYAAPGGQYVPVAPLLDTVIATSVWAVHGRDATTAQVEAIAALVPPLLGALTVCAVFALAGTVLGRTEALLAALLAAILPGHFLDRTLLGFVDHHALEVCLSMATLACLARAVRGPGTVGAGLGPAALAGAFLGLYLLSWTSGAFLVAALALWLAGLACVARVGGTVRQAAVALTVAAGVALVMVVIFEDPALYRRGAQVLALAGTLAGAVGLLAAASVVRDWPRARVPLVAVGLVALVAGVVVLFRVAPGTAGLIAMDLQRFGTSPERMAVLEARPLFLYSGQWDWAEPWRFFGTGSYSGLAGLVGLAAVAWRERAPAILLVVTWTLACLAATIGQNRFGYYLVPAFAITSAWLGARMIEWAREEWHHGFAPVLLVLALLILPNARQALGSLQPGARMPGYWRAAMLWLRDATPPPYPPGYYYAWYGTADPPLAWSVMNWWDQGYWITEVARRVPVSNPTQIDAGTAARFYTETDDTAALRRLRDARARYVLADWEMPFRRGDSGDVLGHLESLTDWAGAPRGKFYDVLWQPDAGTYRPLWVFRPAYYETMAYRLAVHGGRAAPSDGECAVVTWQVVTPDDGDPFREVTDVRRFASPAAAGAHAATLGDTPHVVVGLDPWRSPFPVQAVRGVRQVHAVNSPDSPDAAPWVRIFEVEAP
ncbi:MAG: STT3 domain-containing protein [Vicinamibacterales bacterium]